MSKQRDRTPGDDDGIESLLRQVGARDEPSTDLIDEVQQAVHAEWRAMLAERSRRRRVVVCGLAASIAVALLVVTATLQWIAPDQGPVATITRIDGSLQLASSGAATPAVARVGQVVTVGETLRTDEATRVALAFSDALSVRIDARSTVKLAAADRLVLTAGAVYVDADPGRASADPLEVETRAGIVRHLGTQYQVREDARAVVISIREGRVEIAGSQGAHRAVAGEVLRVLSGGSVERASVSPYDPSWQWASATAPTFDIDQHVLSDFLDWVARETGKRLVYASPQARQAARNVVLRGSIGSLHPLSALAPVLSTTELRQFPTDDGSIGIELAPSPRAR